MARRDTWRTDYQYRARHFGPVMAFQQAVLQRIPKKYAAQMLKLLKAYPEVGTTHQLDLSLAELGLLWACPTAEMPRLLERMTARSQGDITYHLGERQPGLGIPVTLTFTIAEATEEKPDA